MTHGVASTTRLLLRKRDTKKKNSIQTQPVIRHGNDPL